MRSLSYSDSSSKSASRASRNRGECIYIKLYVDELRQLILEKCLTRTEIGELVLLALFMDHEGTCFPSQQCVAETAGKKSGKWAGEIHRRFEPRKAGEVKKENMSDKEKKREEELEKKRGVLQVIEDPEHRTKRYKLPTCFEFGKEPDWRKERREQAKQEKQEKQVAEQAVSTPKSDPTPARNPDPVLTQNPVPATPRNPVTKNSHPTKIQSNQKHKQAEAKTCLPALDNKQKELCEKLHQAGIQKLEALLITTQYAEQDVRKVLRDTQGNPRILNTGGYIRRMIEIACGRRIEYPSNADAMRRELEGDPNVDPYLRDPYFRRQEQRWREEALEMGWEQVGQS